MRRRHRLRPRALLGLLAVGCLAGCGDTGGDGGAAGASPSCEAGAGATVTVAIPEFAFDPEPVEVQACDEVVWRNDHDQPHTSTGDGTQRWSTGNLASGAASEPVRFEEPGSFTYLCALHPFMKGTVEVS